MRSLDGRTDTDIGAEPRAGASRSADNAFLGAGSSLGSHGSGATDGGDGASRENGSEQPEYAANNSLGSEGRQTDITTSDERSGVSNDALAGVESFVERNGVTDGTEVGDAGGGASIDTDGAEDTPHTEGSKGDAISDPDDIAPSEDPSGDAPDGGAYSLSPDGAFEADLRGLLKEFPELKAAACSSVNTKRYGELRLLGLTAREAYLAASAPRGRDNRAHMVAGVPSGARSPELGMSSAEMDIARGIFSELSEQEIKRLYSTVTR